MFNFHLYNGSLPYRVFMALTVAICIWGILSMTTQAYVVGGEGASDVGMYDERKDEPEGQEPLFHIHQGDPLLGTGCYAGPVYHKHTGSRKSGGGCYGKAVKHSHEGDAQTGGGCYGQSLFHVHTGTAGSGGGCYGQAVCHTHSGSPHEGGGCYGTAVYHAHQGDDKTGGACYATPICHQHEGVENTSVPNGCYTKEVKVNVGPVCGIFGDIGEGQWKCGGCGWVIPVTNLPYDRQHWPLVLETRYQLGCGKAEGAVDGFELSCSLSEESVERYELNCGKSNGSVEWYQLSCGKNETTAESYMLTCGLQEGQVVEYKRNCKKSTEDIVGYELSCGMDEQTIVSAGTEETGSEDKEQAVGGKSEVEQPVKVPIKLKQEETGAEETIGIAQMPEGMKSPEPVASGGEQSTGDKEEPQKRDSEAEEEVQTGNGMMKNSRMWVVVIAALFFALLVKIYFAKTVALYYYDDTNRYHSLGRVGVKRTFQGYHVEIGNGLRKRASTDRYRIRASKSMQKTAGKMPLFVRISTQVLKFGVKEYVDFAL